MGRKWGAAVPLSVWGAGLLSNKVSHRPRPTAVPSGVFIHPTIWHNTPTLQTGQTDRTTSRSIGRPLLATVAQNRHDDREIVNY